MIVVEGPTDALAVRQAGLDAVGLIGAGHAAKSATTASLINIFGKQWPFVVMTDHLSVGGDADTAGRLAAQWLATNLWADAASAIYWPPPAAGDLSDWLRERADQFKGDLAEHVTSGLSQLSAATQRALASDPSFIELAAGGQLAPAVAEAWASNSPLAAQPSSATRPARRSAPTAPELNMYEEPGQCTRPHAADGPHRYIYS